MLNNIIFNQLGGNKNQNTTNTTTTKVTFNPTGLLIWIVWSMFSLIIKTWLVKITYNSLVLKLYAFVSQDNVKNMSSNKQKDLKIGYFSSLQLVILMNCLTSVLF